MFRVTKAMDIILKRELYASKDIPEEHRLEAVKIARHSVGVMNFGSKAAVWHATEVIKMLVRTEAQTKARIRTIIEGDQVVPDAYVVTD